MPIEIRKLAPTIPAMSCIDCAFWSPWPAQPESKHVIGDCRLRHPNIFQAGEKFLTKWPSTKGIDFCGDFIHRSRVERPSNG